MLNTELTTSGIILTTENPCRHVGTIVHQTKHGKAKTWQVEMLGMIDDYPLFNDLDAAQYWALAHYIENRECYDAQDEEDAAAIARLEAEYIDEYDAEAQYCTDNGI